MLLISSSSAGPSPEGVGVSDNYREHPGGLGRAIPAGNGSWPRLLKDSWGNATLSRRQGRGKNVMSNLRIDLSSLRKNAAPEFEQWRQATRALFDAAKAAEKSRLSIGIKARDFLRQHVTFTQPGLYLYLKEEAGSLADSVVYIGLVKKRAGSERMLDYTSKQISLLDSALVGLPPAEAEKIIDQQIRAGMIDTSDVTRAKYVREHLKSVNLARANAILLHPTLRGPEEIEAAETLLIRSLVEVTHQPDLLVNSSKTKGAWPREKDIQGFPLALEAIDNWMANGLPPQMANEWKDQLTTSWAHLQCGPQARG